MGFGGDKVQQFDPTPNAVKPLQGDIASFLQGEFQNPGQTFAGFTSPLQQQATGGIAQFLGQQSPEQQVLQTVQPSLLGLLGGGPGMGELGGFSQSQALVGSMQPIFERNLQTALGSLSNSAPGRFSTAFAGQGRDLASQALQDFNLFQNQALQQGLGLDLQNRGLQLEAGRLGQQGVLGAANLLGSLAGQAGQAPFNRLLQAGQFGLGQTQQAINPTLQLLLGGMGFGQPMPQETVIREGGGLGSALGGIAGTALGSFLGPVGAAAGGALGGRLFGGDS